MNSADSFSATYAEARDKFRTAAGEAGAMQNSYLNPSKGPDGGELSADIAWIGPRDAEKVLVMISGTHGAEGFCGSGAQVDWMRRGEAARLAEDAAVLMIHAINPYGFAWLRRVTEDNIDLNRNWIDFTRPLPANPGYDELAADAVPQTWDEQTQARTARALAAYGREHGAMGLQAALSAGQYNHPVGLFYGGSGPSWSRLTQEAIYDEYLGQAGKIAILDYHTGLGPWGYAEPIMSDAPASAAFRRGLAWWGVGITSPSGGTSTSADVAGDGLASAPILLSRAEVTGMALEYGTVPVPQTMAALRADAWLHAYGDPTSPEAAPIKAAIRTAFYGDADDWKGMVCGQSLTACRQALVGLASS